MNTRKYYYISNVNDVLDIEATGIESDHNGDILIFTIDKPKIKDVQNVAGYIALNEMFQEQYALFEILDEGITGEIIDSTLKSKTSKYQKVLKQNIIEKDYIRLVNSFKSYFAI